MRTPTESPHGSQWWRAALCGERPAIIDGEPQPGFYQRRLVKGGPFVAARVWIEQPIDPDTGELSGDEIMRCEVDGSPADPHDQWLWLAANPIDEAEYCFLLDTSRWAKAHRPDYPAADPNRAVDWLSVPLSF